MKHSNQTLCTGQLDISQKVYIQKPHTELILLFFFNKYKQTRSEMENVPSYHCHAPASSTHMTVSPVLSSKLIPPPD